MTAPLIRIRNLLVSRGERTVCRVASLDAVAGARLALVGPNGSGKTTLLRVLSGLEAEFVGDVQCKIPMADRVLVHQHPYLFRGSVLSNVEYGLRATGVPSRQRREQTERWLELLQIESLAGRSAQRLSGGERRRVALARAFALEPDLLLLDEPFAELDEDARACVLGGLQQLTKTTTLIASPTSLADQEVEATFQLQLVQGRLDEASEQETKNSTAR